MDYRETVHLPKTDFPMRAALSEREPAQVKAWEDEKVYEKLLAKNAAAEKFVFHAGPPYANGPIHQGHFLNKILKDLVVKYHLMAGYLTDFVPGWDCHGLPIERQVDKQLGAKKRELSVGEFRRACRKYAEEQIDLQRKDFKRLGILARWDHPYKTMDFRYEADIVRELSQFARRGALYRRKRPVHWCPVDVTALAEAEVEYADKTSPSIYVRFPVTTGGPQGWGLAIWTTTPWTIPANLAITANPELEYVAYDLPRHGVTVVARDLLHAFLADCAPDELAQPSEAGGADPPQLTALLALQEPRDLPRHRPVVDRARHRDRSAGPRPHHHPQGGARRHRRDRRAGRLDSGLGQGAHPEHGGRTPGLVRFATARLGRPDPRLLLRPRPRAARLRRGDGPRGAHLRRGRRRRMVGPDRARSARARDAVR